MLTLPEVIHYTTISDRDALSLGFEPQDLGEFDWEPDLTVLESALRDLGIEPRRLSFGDRLLQELLEIRPPLVWNLNSGLFGPAREAQVPAVCEMLRIPLVGSGSWTACVTQDKTLAAQWVAASGVQLGIVESATLATSGDLPRLAGLPFPGVYLVKPNNEGSSRGIELSALQDTPDGLRRQALEILDQWGPVRVERFVEGIDVSANLACLPDGTLLPLEPVAILPEGGIQTGAIRNGLDSTLTRRREPLAAFDPALGRAARAAALALGRCLRFRHYGRFDLRWEPATRRLYFLEANLCPSFEPEDDYVKAAQWSGLSFPELIANILAAALADARAGRALLEMPAKVRRHAGALPAELPGRQAKRKEK